MKLFPHLHSAEPRKGPAPLQLAAAYAVCRSISRVAARNFYYSFLALPAEKRDALCAVYSFMRHADDVSDDPSLPPAERRARLDDWLERFRRVLAGEPTDDPVLMAVADAQHRYAIPPALLETLVEGTAMDLQDSAPQEAAHENLAPGACPAGAAGSTTQPQASGNGQREATTAVGNRRALAPQYTTFDELRNYCYHVASVVGLICIKIFGYHQPEAEPLAEQCGIAFQLTNIIRDVKEDAAMGRVYIPREDLDRFGLAAAEFGNGAQPTRFRPLLEFEAQRAREFYAAADQLLPMIDEDSRPALWVLVTIYRRLLEKIAARDYDVFSGHVRLTAPEKLRVLAKGLWLRLT